MRKLAVPAACATLAVLAAVLRFLAASWIPGPWYVDEFVYGASARAVAENWSELVRDFAAGFYLYPRLIAPAWLAGSMTTTYAAVHAINTVFVTLASVPVYLWARRLVPPFWRLVAVALVLALPTGLYADLLATENAFFPAFVLAAFALAAALERPSLRSQLLALGAIVLACSVRLQGLVFVLIVPSAIAIKIALDLRHDEASASWTRLARELRRYAPMMAVGAVAIGAYGIWKVATGAALSSGLGAYAGAVELRNYSAEQVFRWVLYHFAGLAIAVGLIPFSVLILLTSAVWRRDVATTTADRALVAVSTSTVVWLVIQVGAFASRQAERISERYMFHVEPIVLLAFVVWLNRGAPRRRPALAVLLPVVLILTLPLNQLFGTLGIYSDTFSLIPLLRASQHVLHGVDELRIALAALAVIAALLLLLLPLRALRIAAPAAVFIYLTVASLSIVGPLHFYARGFRDGTIGRDADWIDEAVPHDARVDVLYTGAPDPNLATLQLRLMHFWNRRVTIVHELSPLVMCCVAQAPARVDQATGRVLLGGVARPPDYVVTLPAANLVGTVISRNNKSGALLYRIKKPLRVAAVSR